MPSYTVANHEGFAMESVIFLVFAFFFYFAPAIVGEVRRHPQRHAISALNLFLGWTLLGWVAALVWALTAVNQPQ